MGVVEDLRKVIQDFVSPDLEAIKTRLELLEKRQNEQHKSLKEWMDFRFDKLEQSLGLERRLSLLEEKQRQGERGAQQ